MILFCALGALEPRYPIFDELLEPGLQCRLMQCEVINLTDSHDCHAWEAGRHCGQKTLILCTDCGR